MAYDFDSAETSVDEADKWATVTVPADRYLEFYVRGTYSATITLQFSPDGGTTWIDRVEDLATDLGLTNGLELSGAEMKWRLGVKSGNYTSGTAVCRIFGGEND